MLLKLNMDFLGNVLSSTGCSVDGTISNNPIASLLNDALTSQLHNAQPPAIMTAPNVRSSGNAVRVLHMSKSDS